MKKLMMCVALAMSMCVVAEETASETPARKQAPTPQQRKEMFQRRMGGFINDTRAQKGRVVIVNAQNEAKKEWLQHAAEVFAGDVFIAVEVEDGSFDLRKPELKGEVTIFVVKDDSLPMSLVAAEAKWAVVNVAKLASDKPAFYEMRTMKEITRVTTMLLGGADSQYPLCVMGIAPTMKDLDGFMDSRLPVDVIDRMKKNMPKVGIVPYSTTTYRAACKAGWAPEPTNDNQRAIWEEYHSKPTQPIHIKFDPKKGM